MNYFSHLKTVEELDFLQKKYKHTCNNSEIDKKIEMLYYYLTNHLQMSGKIFVASMNMRGKWAVPPEETHQKINVTSSQAKNSKNRLAFSPMTEIDGGYKGFYCFENYWQSGKVYEDIDREKQISWWKELKQPKRRYKNSKGKKVLYALFDGSDEKMDYITSRKKIYVPEYYDLIKENDMITYWKNELLKGTDLVIYDFDGPRTENGEVTCIELNEELLINKINDTQFPFGHGYIVAATIAGINPDIYIQ